MAGAYTDRASRPCLRGSPWLPVATNRGLAYAGLALAICAAYYVAMEAINSVARMLGDEIREDDSL